MLHIIGIGFLRFLELLADGHSRSTTNWFHTPDNSFLRFLERCRWSDSQSNDSTSSPAPSSSSLVVWFRKLRFRGSIKFNQEFDNNLFRLPFVRRHSILRITQFKHVITHASGIINWLFDDTDYYGGDGGGLIDGQWRCFCHRHLAIYINERYVSSGDPFPLINAIRKKVSKALTGFG